MCFKAFFVKINFFSKKYAVHNLRLKLRRQLTPIFFLFFFENFQKKIFDFFWRSFSEFYADSESVTFIRFTSIFWKILAVKVRSKFRKCRFLSKIRHGYGLFWYQSIGFSQSYSGSVPGRYSRVCGGRCLYV